MDKEISGNHEVKGHLSAIFPAVLAVWQFVKDRWHLFRLNKSTV